MRHIKQATIALVLVLAGLLIGCGGHSDKNDNTNQKNKVTLSGDFKEAYVQYRAPWYTQIIPSLYADSSFGNLKQAVAVPIAKDRIMMEEAIPLEIDSDGKFTVAVTPDYGWVVILEDVRSGLKFLSIPQSKDDNNSLITFFPKQSIDFGKVAYVSATDEASSEENLSNLVDKFIFNANELKQLARADNAFKSIANNYRNNYGKEATNQVTETLNIVVVNPEKIELNKEYRAHEYRGFKLQFDLGTQTQGYKSIKAVCNNSQQIKLIFPKAGDILQTSDQNFTGEIASSTMHSDKNECATGDYLVSASAGDHGGRIDFFRGESSWMLAQNKIIPKGQFSLKIADTTVGKFDLSYTLPLNNNKLTVPIPTIKLISQKGSAKITKCEVSWSLYNPKTGSYEPFDSKSLLKITHGLMMNINVDGQEINNYNEQEVVSSVDLSKQNIDFNNTREFVVAIEYGIANTQARFSFSKN